MNKLAFESYTMQVIRYVGRLSYKPSSNNAAAIVNEMLILLTSGRMSSNAKQIVIDAYNKEPDKTAALLISQQLIISAPEYYSTGLVQSSGKKDLKSHLLCHLPTHIKLLYFSS